MVEKFFQNLSWPLWLSHKGENGKLLIIGGSHLFHSASRWSLEVASFFVDIVIYCSTKQNINALKESKENFTNGIVIDFSQIEDYIQEVDCILIGPGMERNIFSQNCINRLLKKYPKKKWVIDAGALQMMDLSLLNKNCLITPHLKELELILTKLNLDKQKLLYLPSSQNFNFKKLIYLSKLLNNATILVKGYIDFLVNFQDIFLIKGGNIGLTKGGTGDCLAGLVASLYCKNTIETSAYLGSLTNKKAAEDLAKKYGIYFNTTILVNQIPKTFYRLVKQYAINKDYKVLSFKDEPSFLIFNYDQFTDLVFQLAKKILSQNIAFDRVIILSKGGWPIARILVDFLPIIKIASLGLKFYHNVNHTSKKVEIYQELVYDLKNESILLLDDVADSGQSLKCACDYLKKKGVKNIKIATLFYKSHSIIKPDFFILTTDLWIIFPYEIVETIKSLSQKWVEKGLAKTIIKNRLLRFDFEEKIIDYLLDLN